MKIGDRVKVLWNPNAPDEVVIPTPNGEIVGPPTGFLAALYKDGWSVRFDEPWTWVGGNDDGTDRAIDTLVFPESRLEVIHEDR